MCGTPSDGPRAFARRLLGPSAGRPGAPRRALYNHILAAQDPRTGHMAYHIPVYGGWLMPYAIKQSDFFKAAPPPMPVLLAGARPVDEWVKPVAGHIAGGLFDLRLLRQ